MNLKKKKKENILTKFSGLFNAKGVTKCCTLAQLEFCRGCDLDDKPGADWKMIREKPHKRLSYESLTEMN